MVLSDNDTPLEMPLLELLTEVAPGAGSFGHIPALPGLCFRADNPESAKQEALSQIAKYAEWQMGKNIVFPNPTVATLVHLVLAERFESIKLIETEQRTGSPLWISGNPAALFDYDLRPLDDAAINAHLLFVKQVIQKIHSLVKPLPLELRRRKPTPDQRSINEMLTHIGNCIWWYCSRIDDSLPEPEELAEEEPLSRTMRLFEDASKYLLAVSQSQRTTIHIPTRFRTSDPEEQWTHTKVCRRQAEHVWEHLSELTERIKQLSLTL